jgi:hypothetical protein
MGDEPIHGGEVDARLPFRNGCIAPRRRMNVHRNFLHKGEDMTRTANSPVMAGLVPAIHDLLAARKTWMAVTSTAMTELTQHQT